MANSSSSTKLNISELDFDAIKSALQTYLSSQSEFTDYNFAGSGLSVLLNILSYNTHYLSYYLNMVANEMYLDSADRRENIVSIAKQLGYTPTSRRSSAALVNLVITPPMSPTPPANITIPKNTIFNSSVNGTTFTFVTLIPITVSYNAGPNNYVANNVPIYEGVLYTYQYTVNTSDPVKYVIPNSNVDTSKLTVTVQDSSMSSLLTTFTLADDITVLNGTSNAYFLQEIDNSQYEVYFGDGILGNALVDGNIVILNYLACDADIPNYANIFTSASPIAGYSNVVVTTVNPAAGGAERESSDSIRFVAPKFYQTQKRAVTADDYSTILLTQYPNASSVAVWGGETMTPPQYGKVFISLKPVNGYVITETTKQLIVSNILQGSNIVSIIPVVVDPSYIYLVVNSLVKYNAPATSLSSGQLQTNVIDTINSFGDNSIGQFGDIFRYTQLTRAIDATDPSITNDLTTILMQMRFVPRLNISDNYTILFSNAISPGTLTSATFIDSTDPYYVSGQLYNFDDNGLGVVRTYKFVGPVKTYTNQNSGTINYTTGTVTLASFKPSSITDTTGSLDITVQPSVNDIVPSQNQIIVIDPADVVVNMQVN